MDHFVIDLEVLMLRIKPEQLEGVVVGPQSRLNAEQSRQAILDYLQDGKGSYVALGRCPTLDPSNGCMCESEEG